MSSILSSLSSLLGFGSTPKTTSTPPPAQGNIPEQNIQTPVLSVEGSQALTNVSPTPPESLQGTTNKVTGLFNTTLAKVTGLIACAKERIFSLAPNLSVELTKTKISQAILVLTSGYSLLGVRATFGSLIPHTFASFIGAVPFLAASGILLWYASSLVDYDSEKSRESIRKDAHSLSFGEIIKKYDLDKIFAHQILNNKEFQQVYRSHVATLSINEAISLHSQTRRALIKTNTTLTPCPYEIPHPSELRNQFKEETKDIPLHKLSEKYDLTHLARLKILENDEIATILKEETLHEENSKKKDSVKQKTAKVIDSLITHNSLTLTSAQQTENALKKLQEKAEKGPLNSQEQETLSKLTETVGSSHIETT